VFSAGDGSKQRPAPPAMSPSRTSASGWAITTSVASRAWSTCRSTTSWRCGSMRW
jgi:hypothetical protein